MRIFAKVPNFNFMAQRKAGLWVSSLLSIGVILMMLLGALHLGRNLNFGIDFTGGVLVEVVYPQNIELDSVRNDLKAGGYHNPIVQYFGGTREVLIRLAPEEKENSSAISASVLQALGAEQKGVQLRRIEFVGPQVGDELTVNGSLAMVFAFIGIALYIMFRFEWKFAVGAIAALVHDALMVVGFLWIFQVEFDLTTLAAILALIGYSNNETIVIFDRVRENLINQRKGTIYDIVNLSVNQTLLRSIITHVTTLLVCTALFLLGGPSVHSFSISMIVGVIVATYSSIYVSTGLAVALGVSREDLLPPETKEIDETP